VQLKLPLAAITDEFTPGLESAAAAIVGIGMAGALDWKGQLEALVADGHAGYLSLETHWAGPAGDRSQGSLLCGWKLRGPLGW
jgi:hypothetical protein